MNLTQESAAKDFDSMDKLMSRDVGNGVLLAQGFAKRSKTFILCCLKAFTLQPFKLYAYRVVISIGPTPIT